MGTDCNSDDDTRSTMRDPSLGGGSLYGSLLGTTWADLHPSVRHFHHGGTPVQGIGRFKICRGSTTLARLLARLFRLPPAAASVPTRLIIFADSGGETWQRTFGTHRLVSRQRNLSGRLLAERFGVLELWFRLDVVEGGIVYRQVGAAVRLGLWLARLPRWMSPHVVAQEMPAADNSRTTNVRVHVRVPLAGDLISYAGYIGCEDEP